MRGNVPFHWLILALRIVVGGAFLYAGWLKVMDPIAFADSLLTFEILPRWLVTPVAVGLPILEMALGTMLVTAWSLRVASFSAVVLFSIFAALLGYAMIHGIEIDCGCFGGGGASPSRVGPTLVRDLALLISSAAVYLAALPPAPAKP